MDEIYRVCRYCKHYKEGCCTKNNFIINDKKSYKKLNDKTELVIEEPEDFWCKNWE